MSTAIAHPASDPRLEYRQISTLDERRCVKLAVELEPRGMATSRAIIVQVASERRDVCEPWKPPTLYLHISGEAITRSDWVKLRDASDLCFEAFAARWPS